MFLGFPCGLAGKESACNVGDLGSKIPWRRERLPTPVFWTEEFHGLYSPWGPKELDTTGQLSLFSRQRISKSSAAINGPDQPWLAFSKLLCLFKDMEVFTCVTELVISIFYLFFFPTDTKHPSLLAPTNVTTEREIKVKIRGNRDFSGRPVVKNAPCNSGAMGSIPDWETKIPHASGQLSLRAANTDPAAATREPMRLNERSQALS